ncbi:MAG: hypothetical protein DMF75_22455 [Acidobacteria bacterium]|nr:MAG: hypothetical protein DMF75_22455 [Acidobacteriota bacterium]
MLGKRLIKNSKPASAGDRNPLRQHDAKLCRPLRGLTNLRGVVPSDESLGYCQSSAARTKSGKQE